MKTRIKIIYKLITKTGIGTHCTLLAFSYNTKIVNVYFLGLLITYYK